MHQPSTEQPIAFINVGRVPASVEVEACKALACQRPRKLKATGAEVIEVGLHYRLLKTRRARCYRLMSHERYNKLTSKKKHRG